MTFDKYSKYLFFPKFGSMVQEELVTVNIKFINRSARVVCSRDHE